MSSTSIYYDIDANDEQSGCPVYISGENRKFVGIHQGYHLKRNLKFRHNDYIVGDKCSENVG